jgi:FixJ family two-component response regulator
MFECGTVHAGEGATDFVSKPVEARDLIGRVSETPDPAASSGVALQ